MGFGEQAPEPWVTALSGLAVAQSYSSPQRRAIMASASCGHDGVSADVTSVRHTSASPRHQIVKASASYVFSLTCNLRPPACCTASIRLSPGRDLALSGDPQCFISAPIPPAAICSEVLAAANSFSFTWTIMVWQGPPGSLPLVAGSGLQARWSASGYVTAVPPSLRSLSNAGGEWLPFRFPPAILQPPLCI